MTNVVALPGRHRMITPVCRSTTFRVSSATRSPRSASEKKPGSSSSGAPGRDRAAAGRGFVAGHRGARRRGSAPRRLPRRAGMALRGRWTRGCATKAPAGSSTCRAHPARDRRAPDPQCRDRDRLPRKPRRVRRPTRGAGSGVVRHRLAGAAATSCAPRPAGRRSMPAGMSSCGSMAGTTRRRARCSGRSSPAGGTVRSISSSGCSTPRTRRASCARWRLMCARCWR